MIDTKFIEDIAKKLTDTLPPALQHIKDDMENNFRSILQAAFNRLDLVTREEFDAQVKVLAKTRTKLEHLEEAVKQLEKAKSTGSKSN